MRRGGFTLQEGYVLRQFVIDLQPGQGQGFPIGNLNFKDYFFTEKNLVLAQATPVFDAVEAKSVPQSRHTSGQQKQQRN